MIEGLERRRLRSGVPNFFDAFGFFITTDRY
jgi:hypothetical protein